jgi:MoxR-like ATPase
MTRFPFLAHPRAHPATLHLGKLSVPLPAPLTPPFPSISSHPADPHPLAVDGAMGQSLVGHLHWLTEKDVLGQDPLLIGAPSSLSRRVVGLWAEMVRRKVEYVAVHRDLTEADLKARREWVGGRMVWRHAPPVTAALEGRVLVLDGLERAERNVLPLLNNLLENREMRLEDGTFLMHWRRFDALDVRDPKILRVSPNFRVIGLTSPTPDFPGNPLDPPLRSRFQARVIPPLRPGRELEIALASARGEVDRQSVTTVVTSLAAMREAGQATQDGATGSGIDVQGVPPGVRPPVPPTDAGVWVARLLSAFPYLSRDPATLVFRTFPFTVGTHSAFSPSSILAAHHKHPAVTASSSSSSSSRQYVPTPAHEAVLVAVSQALAIGRHAAILGGSGSGKSVVAREFARRAGRKLETVTLFKDMSSRDLLQRRVTHESGDSGWVNGPLVRAAIEGHIAVLDGLDRVPAGSLAVIYSLLHDGEAQLPDGTRLVPAHTKWLEGLSPGDLAEMGVHVVHRDFFVLALARDDDEPVASFVTTEVADLFDWSQLRPDGAHEETLLRSMFPRLPPDVLAGLMRLARLVRGAAADPSAHVAFPLTTRHLVRIASRAERFPADVTERVMAVMMEPYLPPMARAHLLALVAQAGLPGRDREAGRAPEAVRIAVDGSTLRIGEASVALSPPACPELVPDVVFYDVAGHRKVLEGMLKDFALGQPLLLIGSQGVGKNKLCDRLLGLMQREREYIQLHRDTTVQGLTVQPVMRDGRLVWEDSPLVRAVTLGRVLVIDEADKAPSEVVAVLKNLLEDRDMLLSDGRRIGLDLPVHRDFGVIVLANVASYPFLGNDFARSAGDIFALHPVPNTDAASEVEMLLSYAPGVFRTVLVRLAHVFAELRELNAQGTLPYPYSSRELVSIARHLDRFPGDGIASALANVFDADAHNAEVMLMIRRAFARQGIPFDGGGKVRLAREVPLPAPTALFGAAPPPRGAESAAAARPVFEANRATMGSQSFTLPQQVHETRRCLSFGRLSVFSEEILAWSLFLRWEVGRHSVVDVLVDPVGAVHVLTKEAAQGPVRSSRGGGSIRLHSFAPDRLTHVETDLSSIAQQALFLAPALRDGVPAVCVNGEIVVAEDGHCGIVRAGCPQQLALLAAARDDHASRHLGPFDRLRRGSPRAWAFTASRDPAAGAAGWLEFARDPEERVSGAADHSAELAGGAILAQSFGSRVEVVDTEAGTARVLLLQELDEREEDRDLSPVVAVRPLADGRFLCVQAAGRVRVLEASSLAIAAALEDWRALVARGPGGKGGEPLEARVEQFDSTNTRQATSPKHGKEDSDNEPHVGGNTWAGGTGGADTAGLGGRGGPYRLDKGHDVHQVSDAEKAKVSEEVKRKAAKMAKEALEKELARINMTPVEHEQYERLASGIRSEVARLRVVFQSAQAKQRERVWLKNQLVGDLDEGRFLDGAMGEAAVFRRRADPDDKDDKSKSRPRKPKRLRLVVDLSGSMYRFNSLDSRLQTEMASVLMMMEALRGIETFSYSIVGHSGDDPEIKLVEYGKEPKDDKERLAVLRAMMAHSQYCSSGDFTVEAIQKAVEEVTKVEADEHIVIAISDANMDRYGISTDSLKRALHSDKAATHLIMVGSLGDEAAKIRKALPAHKAFICMNPKSLPEIVSSILLSRQKAKM